MPYDASSFARSLIDARGGDDDSNEVILSTLLRFGIDALRFAGTHGIRIVPLQRTEAYNTASPAIARMGINVDEWPAPPACSSLRNVASIFARVRR